MAHTSTSTSATMNSFTLSQKPLRTVGKLSTRKVQLKKVCWTFFRSVHDDATAPTRPATTRTSTTMATVRRPRSGDGAPRSGPGSRPEVVADQRAADQRAGDRRDRRYRSAGRADPGDPGDVRGRRLVPAGPDVAHVTLM